MKRLEIIEKQNFASAIKVFGLTTKAGRTLASKNGPKRTVELISDYNNKRASKLLSKISDHVRKLIRDGKVTSLEDRSLGNLEKRAERIFHAKINSNKSAYKVLGLTK